MLNHSQRIIRLRDALHALLPHQVVAARVEVGFAVNYRVFPESFLTAKVLPVSSWGNIQISFVGVRPIVFPVSRFVFWSGFLLGFISC